jgi:site-specific recombinase XerD
VKFDRLLHNFRAQISIFGHIRMKTAEFTPDLGKTESSMKPIPMGPELIKVLQEWKLQTRYAAPDDWVFASARTGGKRPMWGENMIRKPVRRALRKLGIYKAIGWHTFRHSYSTLLRSLGTDIKVQQAQYD